MQVISKLHTLLNVILKAYPKLQAIFINIQQYNPTWIVGGASAVPWEFDFISSIAGKWEDELDELVNSDAMYCTKTALGKASLPPRAHFVLGKAVHVQFDIGS